MDRHRLKQDTVNDAEDGGIGTDAERERQDGDRDERRALGEGPKSIPQILEKTVYHPVCSSPNSRVDTSRHDALFQECASDS